MEEPQLDDSAYIGEYLDEDVKEPNQDMGQWAFVQRCAVSGWEFCFYCS